CGKELRMEESRVEELRVKKLSRRSYERWQGRGSGGWWCGGSDDGLYFWKKEGDRSCSLVVKKGDTVVDATCGNGYDTLAMLNMVSDESSSGRVYSLDIQESALKNTASLLDGLSDPDKKEMVKLTATCHSKMEEVIPRDVKVRGTSRSAYVKTRLVAFNLGYLPGGDKTLITKSYTTRLAMEAASRIVASGGLISMLVYVGHPGGMEEYDTVEGFASQLSVNDWICCKLQMLNRPLAPILVLLCKR
ncbi:S-adenosyl-L-methionine-dependent methyltransferases superfamily protein, partial [Tanacetum coccineum]